MCSYDALICRCAVIADWVRIDQSQAECSQEHGCAPKQECPLESDFIAAELAMRKAPVRNHSRLVELLAWRL